MPESQLSRAFSLSSCIISFLTIWTPTKTNRPDLTLKLHKRWTFCSPHSFHLSMWVSLHKKADGVEYTECLMDMEEMRGVGQLVIAV